MGKFDDYLDHCKISGSGRFRFAWLLTNFEKPQRSEGSYFYTSQIIKYVYDCQSLRSAITSIYHYQGKMANGSLLLSGSFPENEWKFVDNPPDSVGADLIETVCK